MATWGPGEWSAVIASVGGVLGLIAFLCGGAWFMSSQTSSIAQIKETMHNLVHKFDNLEEEKEKAHVRIHERIDGWNREHSTLKGKVGLIDQRVDSLEGRRRPRPANDGDSDIHKNS